LKKKRTLIHATEKLFTTNRLNTARPVPLAQYNFKNKIGGKCDPPNKIRSKREVLLFTASQPCCRRRNERGEGLKVRFGCAGAQKDSFKSF